ncbi:MAG: TonB-dependent receptor [Bacteroidota bacterium]|nr:TonB-dependent receptor [Bacteroidota bacterium]
MIRVKSLIQALFFCFTLISFSYAQKIGGTIKDGTGRAIESASIIVKGTRSGTTSNASGEFSINAKPGDEIIVSALGYGIRLVKIEDNSLLSIIMQAQITDLDQIVVLGSRSGGRVKTESPVPVDVISLGNTNLTTARPDLTSLLNYAAPSFNYNKQSGGDGADQIDLATLRGLGPDQTLVLVNGKRRHQTAFVAIFGTRGRGNSGTDLNAIPESAIDRVEILRDGASAQYGSDAIAGVINLVLKKDVNKWQINLGGSGYYDKKYNPYFGNGLKSQYSFGDPIDGKALNVGINRGFAIGKSKKGFINLSGNFFTQGKTFRQVLDTNLNHKDGLPINTGRRANGDASVTSGGAMLNMEAPLAGTQTSFYSFGGYNYKASDAFAYTRTFHGYNGLSSPKPARFPTDDNGNLIWYPSIMKSIPTPGGIPDTTFDPHEQTHITDASLAVGFRGSTHSNWDWDLSNTVGKNDFHYFGDKTFNASLGAAGINKNHFNDGGFSFLQNTTNLDFSKHYATIASGFNLSFGAEYRFEQYKIYAGEKDSYFNYDQTETKAAGSQGFPGFQPADVVNAKRNTEGLYVQGDLDITTKWLITGAVRLENYSDFGFLSTYKFATRYKVSHNVNIRGSISTGYRAPSLQQINFSNTFTNVQGGKSFDVKIAPNYSPITKAAGIPSLKQERSLNASLGFTAKPSPEFTITVDGYIVKIKDRVVLSGQFDTTTIALKSILQQLNVSQAQFFANAVNTTNTGVDIILNYDKRWGGNSLNILLAANFQHMTIDKVNVPAALNNSFGERQSFFSDREQKFVLASAPPEKIGLTVDYGFAKKLKIGTHLTYFGKITLFGYGYATTYPPTVALDADPNTTVPEQFNYNGKLTTDIYASYKLCKTTTFYIGADNLFNVHPDLGYVNGAKLSSYDGEAGGPWDAVQMGTNGLRLFVKAQFNF